VCDPRGHWQWVGKVGKVGGRWILGGAEMLTMLLSPVMLRAEQLKSLWDDNFYTDWIATELRLRLSSGNINTSVRSTLKKYIFLVKLLCEPLKIQIRIESYDCRHLFYRMDNYSRLTLPLEFYKEFLGDRARGTIWPILNDRGNFWNWCRIPLWIVGIGMEFYCDHTTNKYSERQI